MNTSEESDKCLGPRISEESTIQDDMHIEIERHRSEYTRLYVLRQFAGADPGHLQGGR